MLLVLCGRLTQMLIAFLAIKLATTFLSPAAYGQVSLLLSLILGFGFFLVNPVGLFINRRICSWYAADKISEYFLIYAVYLLVICVIAIMMIIILQNSIGLVNGIAVGWIILIVCFSLFFNTANQTFIPFLNLFRFLWSFVWLTLATVISSLVFSAVFVCYIAPRAEYWQFGQVLGQAVFAIIGAIVFFKLLHIRLKSFKLVKPSRSMVNTLVAFSLPLLIFATLNWTQQQVYRFFVSKMLGLEALGLFVAGYSVSAQILAAFENILITCFTPFFYRRIASGRHEDYIIAWRHYARIVFPVLFLTVGFLIIFAEPITRILTGSQFHVAYRYVLYGALADACRVTVNTYAYLAQAQMRTARLIFPGIIGCLVVFILIVLLVASLKLIGVGLALVCAGVAAVLTAHCVLRRQIKIQLPWKALLAALFFIGVLWILFYSMQYWYKLPVSIISNIVMMGIFGIIYLVFLYCLIKKPLKYQYEKST